MHKICESQYSHNHKFSIRCNSLVCDSLRCLDMGRDSLQPTVIPEYVWGNPKTHRKKVHFGFLYIVRCFQDLWYYIKILQNFQISIFNLFFFLFSLVSIIWFFCRFKFALQIPVDWSTFGHTSNAQSGNVTICIASTFDEHDIVQTTVRREQITKICHLDSVLSACTCKQRSVQFSNGGLYRTVFQACYKQSPFLKTFILLINIIAQDGTKIASK